MKSSAPHAILGSGAVIPLNGFGTWKASDDETEAAVIAALEAGYRHIDCAAVYMNEQAVGRGLTAFMKKTGTPRTDIFVTSKVWNTCHAKDDVMKACRRSLTDLQLDYVDLFLVHHPFSWKFMGLPITVDTLWSHDERGHIEGGGVSLQETWTGMEALVDAGLSRDIGVSNYSVALLCDLMQYARIKPSVNQCEAHVYNTRTELRSVCDMFNIHFTMYSVLGSGKEGPLGDETVARIAKEKGASAAQILLAWGIANKCSVLAKSSKPDRIKQNFGCETVNLSEDEVAVLDKLDRGLRVCDMVEYWKFPSHA